MSFIGFPNNNCHPFVKKLISISHFIHVYIFNRRHRNIFCQNNRLSSIFFRRSFHLFEAFKNSLQSGITILNLCNTSFLDALVGCENPLNLSKIAWGLYGTDLYEVVTSFYSDINQEIVGIYGQIFVPMQSHMFYIYQNETTTSCVCRQSIQKSPYKIQLFIKRQVHCIKINLVLNHIIKRLEKKVQTFFMNIFNTSIIFNIVLSQKGVIAQLYEFCYENDLESKNFRNRSLNSIPQTCALHTQNDCFLMLQIVKVNEIIINHICNIISDAVFQLLIQLFFKPFHFNDIRIKKLKKSHKKAKVNNLITKFRKDFDLNLDRKRQKRYTIRKKQKLKSTSVSVDIKRSKTKRKRYLIKRTSDFTTTLFSSICFSYEDLCRVDSKLKDPVVMDNRPMLRCLVKYVPSDKRTENISFKNIEISQPRMMSSMSQIFCCIKEDLKQNTKSRNLKLPLNYNHRRPNNIKAGEEELRKKMKLIKSRINIKKHLK